MYMMLGLQASQIQLTLQVEHFALNEMHFHLFLFSLLVKQVRDHSAGEALLSPAHQHAPFNHLHIIIHLPQAMNYSTLGFPHENSERGHENCLFLVFTLPLTPPPFSLFLGSVSLPHAPLSLTQGGQGWGGITRLQSFMHALYPGGI